jgi:integrase
LLDALTVWRGKRKGQAGALLRPETREQLAALGRERALIYKMLALTGLRKNELATLTVGQLRLDGPTACLELDVADEKNREGNAVPIRADLADDLRAWLAERLAKLQADARLQLPVSIPSRLPADAPLFRARVSVRTFDRDLRLAGISKRDDRGRTLDVHALRMTFGTLLSKGGVPLRTAQAAMRHSDPKLTANVYTDPRLLDVHGALDTLPALPLDATGRESLRATGTNVHDSLALTLAPTSCKPGQIKAFPDNATVESPGSLGPAQPGEIRGFSEDSSGFSGPGPVSIPERAHSSGG